MKIRILVLSLFCCALWCVGASTLRADGFFDSFDTGASPLWGNEVGNWSAAGGVYSAANPSNSPNAYSSLPFNLTDLVVELDINNVADGGIWLRSTAAAGSVGRTGVLLVTGAAGGRLYWHDVTDPNDYGSSINLSDPLFSVGVSDPHLRIEVSGDDYSVFVDGSAIAATTYTTTNFASGQVALYDNSGQTFDNVSVVPEPASTAVLGFGLVISVLSRRRSK